MEESEKRKERLKAMRMGETHSELGSQSAPSPPSFLVNPLNQPCSAPTLDCSPSAQRFDYYTDPVSAFHGNKRKGGESSHPRLNTFSSPLCNDYPGATHIRQPIEGPNRPFTPVNRFQMNCSPYDGPRGFQSPNLQTTPWSNTVARGSSFFMQNLPGLTGPGYRPHDAYPPGLTGSGYRPSDAYPPGLTGPGYRPSDAYPPGLTGPGYRPPDAYPPGLTGPGYRPPDAYPPGLTGPGYRPPDAYPPGVTGPGYRPPNASGPWFPYSSTSRGGFTSSQGRGSNPVVYPGRGNYQTSLGRGKNSHSVNNPTSHPGGRNSYGRKASKDYASAGGNLQSSFLKQMVEDPWKHLEPVVGNILEAFTNLGATDSWLPKSIVTKKAKVNEASKDLGTLSLAEYLAQSFDEAANDEIET